MKAFVCGLALVLVCAAPSFSVGAEKQSDSKAGVVPKAGRPKKVGVDEFEKLWRDKSNVVLDVRTKKEFDAGHIPGAINLDVNAPGFTNKVASLDTNKVYLVHCAAGSRSAKACDQMSRLGFGRLIDLAPGFRGWEKAGKPVEKPAK